MTDLLNSVPCAKQNPISRTLEVLGGETKDFNDIDMQYNDKIRDAGFISVLDAFPHLTTIELHHTDIALASSITVQKLGKIYGIKYIKN